MSTLFAMAQNGRIDLRQKSKAEITHSDFNSLRASFSYGSIESIDIATERGTFSEIAIEGTYASGEIGTPELPTSHQLLAVPFGATPRVNVINYTTTDYRLSDYGIGTILPHQPSVRKDQNLDEVEFVYNAAAYQTRSLATAPEASIEVQGTMRGIRIGSLVINPVSYNPASNTLRVFNNIEVEVSFDGADRTETERMLLSTYSPYFDIVYKQMFNYRQILDVYDDHPDLMAYPVHMIVIAPQDYVTALQPWLNWKTQKGFYVNLVTKEQAGSNYNAIRSYVQNLYTTGVNQGATPTFLVLVGDVAQIPNTTGSQTQKVTDLYYGSVDSDYFPDMFYSRMSAENASQVTAIVNKILQYEQYTMPDPSYLNNVTLIAGWDSYWTSRVGAPTINYATTYYYNTAHGFTEVHSHVNQSQYNGCYNALSTGIGFVNYTAHGDNNMWYQPQFTNTNVNQLTNTNKYFLAMGNCCLSGNFGYSSTCFGEAMIRAENKAAYSYIGSCPNTYWYEDYYFGVGATNVFSQTPTLTNTATGVYDGIWMDDTYHTVSSIVFLGNLAVCYAHAGNYQTSGGINPTYYWQAYHVLGDGSIMPYRVNPTPNTVNHASTFPAGATSFTVNAEAGSYVGISQNNILKGAALVPASGSVNVQVASGITSGQVRIVVTKPQRQPYIQDINVGGAPQSYTITVSANPTNGGTVTGGGTYNQGTSCTVAATPASGYTFTNWTENGTVVSTQASYTFTVTGNRTLVANFQAQTQSYTINVSANPTNGGTVSGGGTYQQGQSCTVHATANSGYTFTNWTENGSVVSTNANYTFTVNSNRTLVANFQAQPQNYTITVSANPTNGGTVTGGGTYQQGQSCTVHATPATGYTFLRWTENGTQVSSNANYTFTVNANRTLVAHFQVQSYNITVTADPANGGTVTGGGYYNYGQSCTLTATPASGYTFVNWTRNGTQVSTNPSYTFTVNAAASFVAHFQAIEPCAVPTNVTAEAINYTDIRINWTGTDAPSYKIFRNGTLITSGYPYVGGYYDTELPYGEYCYTIVSECEQGDSDPSEEACVTLTIPCNTPSDFTAEYVYEDEGNYGVQLRWVSGVTIYPEVFHLYRWIDEEYALVADVQPSNTTYTTYFDDVDVGNYSYMITAEYHFDGQVCISEAAYAEVEVTSVNELSRTVGIYPNPVNDKLTIEAQVDLGTVEIYNLMGTSIYSQRDCANKVEINTADLPSGIYFIRMTNDKTSETRRFVKE